MENCQKSIVLGSCFTLWFWLAVWTQANVQHPAPSFVAQDPNQTAEPAGLVDEDFGSISPNSSSNPQAGPNQTLPEQDRPVRGRLGTISESIFGNAYAKPSPWHPLLATTFFSEGWDEPYVASPAGSGGAARGGWINGFDGVFFRAWFLDFAYLDDFHHNGAAWAADYRIYVPFNRRFELRIDVPFLVTNRGGPSNQYQTSFGDFTVSPRFLISETQDFSQVFALNVRTPTGQAVNAGGVTSLTPQYQFWANPAGPWILRGGTGLTIPTLDQATVRNTYFANLGIGQFFARDDAKYVRDLYWYLVANVSTTVDHKLPASTFVSLSPGVRFALTRDHMWHFLAAIETPVTGPHSFRYAPVFLLLKDY